MSDCSYYIILDQTNGSLEIIFERCHGGWNSRCHCRNRYRCTCHLDYVTSQTTKRIGTPANTMYMREEDTAGASRGSHQLEETGKMCEDLIEKAPRHSHSKE